MQTLSESAQRLHFLSFLLSAQSRFDTGESCKRVTRSIGLVIVVERVVPPGAVSFLFGEDVFGEMGYENLLFFGRKHFEALGGVIEAVVVEVA